MSNTESTSAAVVLALDLGGTWIKGCAHPLGTDLPAPPDIPSQRWPNPVNGPASGDGFAQHMLALCRELAAGRAIRAVVASTAGEVDAQGQNYRIAGAHLGVMATSPWRARLQAELGCPVNLLNDAEAFALGLAELGLVPLQGAVGALAIGTGLGFSVIRDGRWWKPARRLNFLGCTRTPDSSYDDWASAVRAAEKADGNLVRFLVDPAFAADRTRYLAGLSSIIATASILYHLDELVLGGGLVDAAAEARTDLSAALAGPLPNLLPPSFKPPRLQIATGGNQVILRGVLALAAGNAAAEPARFQGSFNSLATERPHADETLESMSAAGIAGRLAEAEQVAGGQFLKAVPALGNLADAIAGAIRSGGRVIYVGAGTSGRLGALDAVEIPCTFGLKPDRFVAVVAGGAADAGLTIEQDGEEDVSSVPDLLLLQPSARDVVVGISASGSAFFVRSALAFARGRGARTALLHEGALERDVFLDLAVPLFSGPELVSGSTRMKAGTATKKALNILSTTAMIRLGKIRHGAMVEVACLNEKLRSRACRILAEEAGLSLPEAEAMLARHRFILRAALDEVLPAHPTKSTKHIPAAGHQ